MPEQFATTHWTLVAAAANRASPGARAALARLCEEYWSPLYAFVRRQGYAPTEAEDLAQGFFAAFLERNALGQVDRERGRFRSFLLASLEHYLLNEADRRNALKRGGGWKRLPLDMDAAEQFHRRSNRSSSPAADQFTRQWALTLLDRVLASLREEAVQAGKGEVFERLAGRMTGADATGHAEVARALGLTEGAVKVALHRLRARFGERLRLEIARTVATEEEIDDEIRDLFEALRS